MSIGRSKGDVRDAFLGTFWQNRMLAPLPPGSATDVNNANFVYFEKNKLGSQQCLNKQPGYICDCDRGYELVAPGYQCRGKLWLYLASNRDSN